ncbi:MAG: hypothetical protein WBE76_24410 [Terracidiphilus sp.]
MRLWGKVWAAAARSSLFLLLLLAIASRARAATCISQAELPPTDRDQIAAAGLQFSSYIQGQDFTSLQAALLPSITADWEGIHSAAEQAATLVKGGQIQIRNVFLLDATMLTAPADTQFFCSDASGSMTVTLTMRALPPGRYAVVLADAVGAPLAGQLGFILAFTAQGWKLGGLSARQGAFVGHDGVWYWTRARDAAKANLSWSAWYLYDAARYLLVPVDYLSSPNLQKLDQEQALLKDPPRDAFPLSLADGPRTWKIDGVDLDATLNEPDLGVTYDSMGVTDPAAARTEAVAVLSALLKAHPDLKQSFHGMWAYAMNEGKRTFAIELPMAQIP